MWAELSSECSFATGGDFGSLKEWAFWTDILDCESGVEALIGGTVGVEIVPLGQSSRISVNIQIEIQARSEESLRFPSTSTKTLNGRSISIVGSSCVCSVSFMESSFVDEVK